jgi:hypothetical protein
MSFVVYCGWFWGVVIGVPFFAIFSMYVCLYIFSPFSLILPIGLRLFLGCLFL